MIIVIIPFRGLLNCIKIDNPENIRVIILAQFCPFQSPFPMKKYKTDNAKNIIPNITNKITPNLAKLTASGANLAINVGIAEEPINNNKPNIAKNPQPI